MEECLALRWRSTWLVVVILAAVFSPCVWAVPAVAFPGSISKCPNVEDRQFVISVPSSGPLGLRLSDKLEILEFIADTQGRSRAVEASGLAEIGDRLLSVNNVTLTGLAFQIVLTEISKAALPRQLRFQTYDGRCIMSSSTAAGSTGNSTADASTRMDVLVLSVGTRTSDQSFFAVPSADGQPPGCLFRDVIVSDPPHACSPLHMDATEKYVIVPDILGCPAHQKAAFAQEAGAAGVVFVQRESEKPQQVRVPSELPTPISLPLVMVSFASGEQIVATILAQALPTQATQLRFVFSRECTDAKYSINPDDDPFERTVANRIASASAGYLSLTVAETGVSTTDMGAFEFLRPQPMTTSATTTPLPLGRQPLFVRASSSVLNACELRADATPPNLVYWADEVDSAFVLIELRASDCSLATQVAYFAAKKALGVVFADASFPAAASLATTRLAAHQAAIPFVIVSAASMMAMREFGRDGAANHILIEFAGENALQHQWTDLELLQDVANWPTTERARARLFYRMLKDQEALSAEAGNNTLLVKHERRDTLEVSFEKVKRYYQQRNPSSGDDAAGSNLSVT